MRETRIWNEDGKCHSFDSRGSGYGRGEGVGMIALKRLDDAMRDGDPIRAILRNTSINQDGKTNGIMVPKSAAQYQLIRQVYHSAGLRAQDTSVVEAHGTGTALGDFAEMSALAEIFGERSPDRQLYVGSLKANFGHLESASGVAGVIKGVLMLENDTIPATINIETLKSGLPLNNSGIEIPRVMVNWPGGTSRRLSVNSFGYGGTNAHAILERAPSQIHIARAEEPTRRDGPPVQQIVPLSARSEQSCRSLIENLKTWISSSKESRLEELAHTLASHRSRHPWRMAVTASSFGELDSVISSRALRFVKSSQAPEIIFVFTGQGAQWYGMGRELLQLDSAFRDSIETSDTFLRELGSAWSLLKELQKDENVSLINESAISQPATTALQIALVELLAATGVKPAAVLGHSSGEIAAAYAAGKLGHADAIRIAYFRGRLKPEERGAMLAVDAGEEDIELLLSSLQSAKAVVACANSPSSTTVSGDEEAIEHLVSVLNTKGIWSRRLKIDRAYHSHHMNGVADQYLQDLRGTHWSAKPSSVRFVSSVTGKMHGECDVRYWVRNLVSKVRFHLAFANVLASCSSEDILIVELGPHGALAGPIRQISSQASSRKQPYLYSVLTRNRNAIDTFSGLAASLFERGAPIDVGMVNGLLAPDISPQVITSLPPYPWDHSSKYWHESQRSKEHRFRKYPYHDLLGLLVPGGNMDRPVWRHVLDLRALPWLGDHVIDGEVVFPASGFVSMVIEAVRQYACIRENVDVPETFELKDVHFLAALALPKVPKTRILFLHLEPEHDSGWAEFRMTTAFDQATSVVHCRGRVKYQRPKIQHHLPGYCHATTVSNGLANVPDPYREVQSNGNTYGPHFAIVKDLQIDPLRGVCTVRVPNLINCLTGSKHQPHVLHPTTLDAMTHTSVAIFGRHYGGAAIVVESIESIIIKSGIASAPGSIFDVHTSVRKTWPRNCCTEIKAYQATDSQNMSSELVFEQKGTVFRALSTQKSSLARRAMSYQLLWGLDVDFIKSQHIVSTNSATAGEDLAQSAKFSALNRASTVYIERCLQSLDAADVPSIQHHRWLLDWMRRFSRTEEFSELRDDAKAEEMLEEVQQLGVEGEVLSLIGDNLADILTAKVDPLALITDEGLLWRLYADDASTRCYGYLSSYLQHLVFKHPTLDVLEIGAGTGGATEPILTALSEAETHPFQSYVFSDISAAFFERARVRLNKWSDDIIFAKLDIEHDPVDQGFQEGSFDLILASNVLHVSISIDGALSRIKRLLKPGGRLVLIETIKNVPFYNTCLGVLPGWWAGCHDGRPDGPFLSVSQWDEALIRNGLGGVAVSAKDFDNAAHRCAMLISQPFNDRAPSSKRPAPVQVRCCPNWTESFADRASNVLIAQTSLKLERVPFFDEISEEAQMIVLDNGSSPILTTREDGCFRQVVNILSKAAKVFWISLRADPHGWMQSNNALMSGFARVARVENASLKLVTLDMQENVFNATRPTACFDDLVSLLDLAFLHDSPEEEYVYEDGVFTIPRIVPDRQVNEAVARDLRQMPSELQPFHQSGRPLRLSTNKANVHDGADFEEDDRLQGDVAHDEVEIHVQACGVTYEDARMMSGYAQSRDLMTGEFSGVIEKYGAQFENIWAVGDRVCGFGATPYASRIRIRGDAIAKMTQGMSFALAAALPFYHATAWHALVDIAALEQGQTVLVHGANSVVGQAAVAIARWRGSKVFAYIESDDQQGSGLVEAIPEQGNQLSAESKRVELCSSGYDVVVNASRIRPPQELADFVAGLGTYVDLAYSQASSRALPFVKAGTRYAFPNVVMLGQKHPNKIGAMLSRLLSLVKNGHLRAPSLSIRPISELKDSFAEASGKPRGTLEQKVVFTTEKNVKVSGPPMEPESLQLSSDGTYVIAGGLGGLGYEIAKLFARHGALNLVLLTRRTLSTKDIASIGAEFTTLGTNVQLLCSDVTNLPNLSEQLLNVMRHLPPIRGMVQCAMVLRDRIISQMTLQDFTEGIAPKVTGTRNLLEVLEAQPLDFCLMLSSIVGSVVGTIAEGSYAAGNAFLSHLSRTQRDNGPRMIAVSPGAIDDVGILSKDRATKSILARQGLRAVSSEHVLALIKYCLGESMTGRRNLEIISGFDYQSLDAADSPLLGKRILSHLLRNKRKVQEVDREAGTARVEQPTLEEANSFEEAVQIVLEALKGKIASLVVISGDIDPTRSMSELGADSLVVIELKNWINQTFRTNITTSAIADSRSTISLVRQIALQCPIIAESTATEQVAVSAQSVSEEGISAATDSRLFNDKNKGTLPKLPLPDLDSTLQYWLKAVQVTLNESDYRRAEQMVRAFQASGGIGLILQNRLVALANHPTTESWQENLYNTNFHMKARVPLVPHRCFYGTHWQSSLPHTQAERAAIITVACLNFRTLCKAGDIEREVVNEQILDAVQYQYLFNTSREPRIHEDVMVRYPDSEHIIAFRCGNAFKIPLTDMDVTISFRSLRTLFEQIIARKDLPRSWVGVLTADSRNEWMENRTLLRSLSSDNSAWLQAVESAAFIINLDEASPATPSDRGHLFLHANGFNRWSDKPIQFTITGNGYSAATGEHSMIDGYTMRRVNACVNQAIQDYIPDTDGPTSIYDQPTLEGFAFKTNPCLDTEIKRVRQQLLDTTSIHDCISFDISTVDFDFYRSHKIAPKSAIQVAIQLACRRFFGVSHLGHEPVSISHFSKGRVDINHILWSEVKEFCDAASEEDCKPAALLPLFVNATKAHASNLMRCSRGQGSDRHLLCLEWMLEEAEEIPELFASKIYRESRPRMIMTDCLETGFLEVGSWPSSMKGLWVHFEPGKDAVKFSVWGPVEEVDMFPKQMRYSLEFTRKILEDLAP